MKTTDFIICCRRLVGALRQPPRADVRSTFFVGFDADGLPFYKTGGFNAGQSHGASGEPLFFCPFCGRRVREGGEPVADVRRSAPRRAVGRAEEDGDEELTRPAEAGEVETLIAPRRAQESAAGACAGGFAG